MNTKTAFAAPPALKTYLFGGLSLHRNEVKHTYALRVNGPRLILVAGVAFLICYGVLVSAGYLWLREVRKIDRVGFFEVAFFQVKKIRQEMGGQQFAMMQSAVTARDYHGAFVAMNSALHNAPDDVAGRLQAASFLKSVGAGTLAIDTLEDGLARTPDNWDLVKATLDFLTTMGRDDQALKLLHGQLAPQFSGPNGTPLRTYEIQASLNAEGPAAARRLLDGYPDLRKTTASLPMVARVLWDTQDRMGAIETISAFIKAQPANFPAYADLAEYQMVSGLVAEARQTADLACAQFPKEAGPRVLRIAMLAPTKADEMPRWGQEIESYLKDFGDKPEAVDKFAAVCGQRGWVQLARMLYETGAARPEQGEARILAMYYSDALVQQQRFSEAQRVLAELDRQTSETSTFSLLLWQREVIAAAAGGDHDDARESARRLASALRNDPDNLEFYRRHFIKLKIPEAVAELTVAAPAAKSATASITPGATAPALKTAAPDKS